MMYGGTIVIIREQLSAHIPARLLVPSLVQSYDSIATMSEPVSIDTVTTILYTVWSRSHHWHSCISLMYPLERCQLVMLVVTAMN